MKIWYLYHSGYAIQTATCLLIFDYWNDEPSGETRALETGVFEPVNWLAEVARTSPDGAVPDVVVFASHKHGDHFNPLILEWQNIIPNIRYVLSNDIPKPTSAASRTRPSTRPVIRTMVSRARASCA